MTDHQPNDFSREQRAFGDALRGAAQSPDFAPLRLDDVLPERAPELSRLRPKRPPWLAVLPVAATLMIVAIAGSVLLNLLQRSVPTAGSGTAGAPAEAFPRGSEVRAEDKATGGLPTPNPGWRWVTYRDWALQVPQEWGYGFAPRSDWCVEGRRFGQRPFVDPYGDRVPVRSI
ncbi:MAG: hypothetical protein WAS07_10945, partial [Micropruina sp.]